MSNVGQVVLMSLALVGCSVGPRGETSAKPDAGPTPAPTAAAQVDMEAFCRTCVAMDHARTAAVLEEVRVQELQLAVRRLEADIVAQGAIPVTWRDGGRRP